MMRLACLLAIAGFLLPQQAAAESNETMLSQFAYTAPVDEGADTVRRVELPFDALRKSLRRDRRDVQVFDATGLWMPGKLFYLSAESTRQTHLQELAYFPVERRLVAGKRRYSVQLASGGEQIALNLSTPGGLELADFDDYIVYADKQENESLGDLVGLQFDWTATDRNVVISVRIEGSHDLETWAVLTDKAVVSQLEHAGTTLTKKLVRFKPFAGDYLRVTWPRQDNALQISAVKGQFSQDHRPTLPWRSAHLSCEPGEADNECGFDIGGVPAERMRFVRGEGDYFLQGDIASRAAPDRGWIIRGGIQQYQLSFEDAVTVREWNVMPGSADPFWKVTFSTATVAPYPRQLELRWRPVYLAFIAQGQPPYSLAVGSTTSVLQGDEPLATVLKRANRKLADIEIVSAGAIEPNQGLAGFWTRDRIETYLLWAVLVVGVGVMLSLAVGLFKRMDAAS